MAKVIVAMSGGVDSSLAAALLKEQGHEVIGVTLHLWEGDDERLSESLCCSQEMAESARRVAAQLGIPYYVFNYQQEFRRHVIDYFLEEYSRGYTPNPCIECNREIKFRAMLRRMRSLGYDLLATGHYARVRRRSAELAHYDLLRAADEAKDQSYMLYILQQDDLARLLFPLGDYTKAQVRAMAAERGLFSANRPESQDICFVPGGDYRNLLREEHPEALHPGPIIDLEGQELGQHQGLPLYTIGQRRGLGLGGGQPFYVTGLDVAHNTLIVGPSEALVSTQCLVEKVNLVDGDWPAEPFTCAIQVRAHALAVAATVAPFDQRRLRVSFDEPQRAVTPGQAAVFYNGVRVIGGGRIARPESL